MEALLLTLETVIFGKQRLVGRNHVESRTANNDKIEDLTIQKLADGHKRLL